MLLKSENCEMVNQGYTVYHNMLASEFPFYLKTTGHVCAPIPFFTTRSERNDYQLIYTRSGVASITYKGVSALLTKGSVTVIDCMVLHDYRTISADPWVYDYIHFAGSGVKNYAPYLLDSLHVVQLSDTHLFDHAFERIFSGQLRNDALSSSRIFTLVACMLNALMEARELPELLPDSSADALLPAVDYIRGHYQENIPIEKLSELCHLSKYYFIRSFRLATGVSPHQYLIKFRINQSKILLANSKLPVEQVAIRVGFSNYSNFANQFKRLTNVTPSAYRSAVTKETNVRTLTNA